MNPVMNCLFKAEKDPQYVVLILAQAKIDTHCNYIFPMFILLHEKINIRFPLFDEGHESSWFFLSQNILSLGNRITCVDCFSSQACGNPCVETITKYVDIKNNLQ